MTALATTEPAVPSALRAHMRATVLLATKLGRWAIAGASMILHGSGRGFTSPTERADLSSPTAVRLRRTAASMSATQLKQIAPTDALAWNARIPVSSLANPPARPFVLTGSAADRQRSLECLTAAIYYEAATEPLDGQRGVAQVVLNRVRHPAYPSTVCGVVFEGALRSTGCQFSFTCDGSLRRAPMDSLWQRARGVAEAALDGHVYAPVGWATHYHANYVVPYWASSLVKSANIGAHIFYRWRGGWGRAPAFVSRYAGIEPVIRWRGGFGQLTAAERLAAAEAGAVDAAAAAAAAGAAPIGSVDRFNRAVRRRNEPHQRENAKAMIAERARADRSLTNAQRWALTGDDAEADTPQQRPLGRWSTAPTEPPPIAAPPPPVTPRAADASAADAAATAAGSSASGR
ncbi:MAG: cell wall hydrolase [Allosphingosinicella sp.]